VLVAIGHLVARAQLLVVLVLDAQRPANVVDDVLVGGGIVATRRFVSVK
jgi:hypothetical protein